MKKNYFLRTLLLVVALCGVTTSWGQTYEYAGAGTFEKITSVEDLTTGYYVLEANGYAMQSTLAAKITGVEVSVNGTTITDPESSIVWKIESLGDGLYALLNADGNYLGYSTKTNFATSSGDITATTAQYKASYDNGFILTIVSAETRCILINSSNKFGPYATSNASNEEYGVPQLYKLKENDLVTPSIAFNEVEGDKFLFFSEGATYNSAATATPAVAITYSSSNEEVATINGEGIVTLVGAGETTIKAATVATDQYNASAKSYVLTVKSLTETLPYSNDFKSGLGNWLNYTTVGKAEWASSNYGAKVSGFFSDNTETEAYLVSPAVTTTTDGLTLAFSTWKKYEGNAVALLYSTNFDPATMEISEATWVDITDQATWPTEEQTWTNAELSINVTQPVRFAFKYTSTTDASATWEVTDLTIAESTPTVSSYTVTVANAENGKVKVLSSEPVLTLNEGDVENNVPAGTKLKITVEPDSGYEVASALGNETPLTLSANKAYYEATVAEDLTITVTFEKPKSSYTVTVTTPENGTLTVKDGETAIESGASVVEGTVLTVVAEANEGFELAGITVNGNTLEATEGVYSFTLTQNTTVAATFNVVEVTPEYCTYGGTNQHAERSFNSLSVTGGKEDFTIAKYVGNGGNIYQDCTDQILTAEAGAELVAQASWNGVWMHDYLYIDYNGDYEFDANINSDGTPAEGCELVAYNYYSPEDNKVGFNIFGETLSEGDKFAGAALPAFTLPTDLKTGDYRVRYKIDWSNIDPCGIHADGKNSLNGNGGLILDFTLRVVESTVEPGTGDNYNGQGVFTKVTSATEITDGSYVFVAGGYIMSNTVSSKKMLAVEVGTKLSADALTVTDPEVDHVWNITVANGIYTIKNGENILGYSSGTDFTFNTTPNETAANDQWTLSTDYDTPLFQSVASTNRFILMKTGTTTSPETRFAPYAQDNINGNGYVSPSLYKWNKETVAIDEVEEAASLKVINGKGQLTILAGEATHLTVYSITGAMVVNTTIEAGNTVIALPAGIYVVNGVKAIVF